MLSTNHIPVLMKEAIDGLNVRSNLNYVDVTFGVGGYSEEILKKANCNLLAIDKDLSVFKFAKKLKDKYKNRFSYITDDFKKLRNIINKKNIAMNGGIVADLGVSSMQIDDSKRGFSFMRNGPLDMRMNSKGITAQDLIYTTNEKELAKILWEYGNERQSRVIAKHIVKERDINIINTTFKLVDIIKKAKRNHNIKKIHPATKTFQALRIAINEELKSLDELLKISEEVLLPGARLVIVTFHSLEDRMVKVFFNKISGKESNINRHLPEERKYRNIKFKIINKKPIFPNSKEVSKNIRARSAKLRVIERMMV